MEFGKALGPVLPAFIAFQSSRDLVFLGVCVMRWSGCLGPVCSWSLVSTDQDLISLRFRSDIFGSSSFSFSSQKSEGKNFSVVVFDSPYLLSSWVTS